MDTRKPYSYCDEPTARGDEMAEDLRTFYEANCPELHLGGWRGAISRGLRWFFFGFRDYDVDRDRDAFMSQLLDEARKIYLGSGLMHDGQAKDFPPVRQTERDAFYQECIQARALLKNLKDSFSLQEKAKSSAPGVWAKLDAFLETPSPMERNFF